MSQQDPIKEKIGRFLFNKRMKMDKTLRTFSLEFNVDAVFISKLERNKLVITENLLPHIAKLYGVTVEELKSTDWEVDNSISLPIFLPAHITEEQLKKLLNAIREA